MLKLAVLADIHLPSAENSVQADALGFAVESMEREKPDVIVCVGDITADGTPAVGELFQRKLAHLTQPRLIVLGNSDIRTPATRAQMEAFETPDTLNAGGIPFLGIHTASGTIPARDRARLLAAENGTVVILHHPPQSLRREDAEFLQRWLATDACRLLICGHWHEELRSGKILSVRALDPDKAIGGPPAVTYVTLDDAGGWEAETDFFPAAPPDGWRSLLGLSCFDAVGDIGFAAQQKIWNIELRPNAAAADRSALREALRRWRGEGGRYVSVHLPDYGWRDGSLSGALAFSDAIRFACDIGANGVTTHVPRASLDEMQTDARQVLLDFFTRNLRELPSDCAVGIENMHMTEKERPDGNRRFGYTPVECLAYMEEVNGVFGAPRAGILLDVGHARNNAPYSQKYPLGAWYSMVGEYTVAYHIHQVVQRDGRMENHMPLTDVYGPLISFCGFAHAWNQGLLAHKPLFLEIRGGREQYEKALACLRAQWEMRD